MAWFSFHGGHSGEFCRHARGTLEAVVKSAAARGFTTYGLSEHAPRYHREHLFADEDGLTPEDLQNTFRAYAARAKDLQADLRDKLEILVGFEAEVVPVDGWLERMANLRQTWEFDYVVGSVHFVDDRPIDYSAELTARIEADCGGRGAFERAYFDTVTDMIRRLQPEVVGHIDLCRKFRGDDVEYDEATWPHIEKAIRAAADCDAVLDVNAAPERRGTGPVYPSKSILMLARLMGVAVTLGDDSHGPDTVGGGLEACVKAIHEAGYDEIACLHRRNGRIEQEFVPIAQVAAAQNK